MFGTIIFKSANCPDRMGIIDMKPEEEPVIYLVGEATLKKMKTLKFYNIII